MIFRSLFISLLAVTAHAAAAQTMPVCTDLEMGAAGGHDCTLPGRDSGRLNFVYEGGDGAWTLVFHEVAEDGTLLFSSDPIDIHGVQTAPELRDITGDGIAELFVPYSAGMVNIRNLVWAPVADGWRYMGEVGGFGAASLELRDGLILSAERGNAATYYETAHTVRDGDLVALYQLEVDYAGQRCTLLPDADLAGAGLTEAALIETCEAREW